MTPVGNRDHQRLRGFATVRSVPALLGPVLDDIPIRPKLSIHARPSETRLLKTCHPDQFTQIMGVAGIDLPFIRELMSLRRPGDAGLDRTFHRVTRQVVRAVIQARIQ